MRLVSVTVRNYRIHREKKVDFDPSLMVIGGPNESGKSTIVEAVHRALFLLRSRTSTAVLDTMRSQLHPGNPSVELTFESGGSTYTITKEFTGNNSAVTTLTEAGKTQLRNKQAEEKLRELLNVEAIGGRGAEERLRMQWAHLWVWQGVAGADPLDGEAMKLPLDRLHGRLGSQIRECELRLAAIAGRRTATAEQRTAAIAAEQQAEERCSAAQTEARGCQRDQATVAELAELHARFEHLERRRTDRAGLAGRCGRIAVLRAEAAGMQTRLDALPAVTAADLTDLTDLAALERKRDAAQATLDAIATRVELLAADGTVRLGDHRLAVGVPETITADADLAVGATRLRITPGGGTSLTEATRARDDANATLEAHLHRAGVADVDEARRSARGAAVDRSTASRTRAVAVGGECRAAGHRAAVGRSSQAA